MNPNTAIMEFRGGTGGDEVDGNLLNMSEANMKLGVRSIPPTAGLVI